MLCPGLFVCCWFMRWEFLAPRQYACWRIVCPGPPPGWVVVASASKSNDKQKPTIRFLGSCCNNRCAPAPKTPALDRILDGECFKFLAEEGRVTPEYLSYLDIIFDK